MKFLQRIIGMITKPDETTKEIAAKPYIEEGLLVVGVYTVLSILSYYVGMSKTIFTGEIEGINMADLQNIMLIIGIVTSILFSFVMWPILTGIYHLLSMFFGADGKYYPNMLSVIGFTAIPVILLTLINVVLGFLKPVTYIDMSMAGAGATQGLLLDPLSLIGTALTLICSLWTFYLVMLSVKNGEKISATSAAIVAGVVLVIYLLVNFGSMALALLGFLG